MPVKHTPPLIEVRDLAFSYGRENVLEDVSFTIASGDYVGIIGPNGGGKSTLLKILIGLLPLQTGSATIDGQPVGSAQSRAAVGYVPQRITQRESSFPATVEEIVASGRASGARLWQPWLTRDDQEAIADALAVAQVSELRSRLIGTLSGGQRQRVYIARALASHPRILILDEPLSGVDAANQQEFYAFLKHLNQHQGLTILFVSHDIDAVLQEACSVLCLNQGLLCFDKTSHLQEDQLMREMYQKPVTHLHHL